MDILCGIVKNQVAAVRNLAAQGNTVFSCQLHQQFLAGLPQIPCDDQIKICGGTMKIFQMGPYGAVGGRG